MSVGVCGYCGGKKKLCNAHIVPECFYVKPDYEPKPYLALIANDFVKRVPKGMYDENILCAECDNTFSIYENHAKKVFNYHEFKKYEVENTENVFFSVPKENFDYRLLRNFFLSLIWKASISSEGPFKDINLGKYENLALSVLNGTCSDDEKLFAVLTFRYKDPVLEGIVSAFEKRLFGYLGFFFVFSGFLFFIIPNPRNLLKDQRFEQFLFSKNKLNVFEVEEDFAGFLKMAKNTYQKQQDFIQKRKSNG